MHQLPSSFFARDTVLVARELLGKILEVQGIQTRIVETEAYSRDPASHAFHRTERSQLMFDTYGHIYVYLIYGMYYCVNITTNKNDAGAVLIRAVEPLTGISLLQQRRKVDKIHHLCNGPGKLCQALAIDKRVNGLKLGKEIKIFDDEFKADHIDTSSRIGIKDAQELPWRFFIKDNPFVSKR